MTNEKLTTAGNEFLSSHLFRTVLTDGVRRFRTSDAVIIPVPADMPARGSEFAYDQQVFVRGSELTPEDQDLAISRWILDRTLNPKANWLAH